MKMTRLMMNVHEVSVRAGPLDGTNPFGVIFDGSEFHSIDASSSNIFAASSISIDKR